MGAVHSRERNSVQFRASTQTIEECIQARSFNLLRRELLGSTREQRRELFRTGSLPRCIHDVISLRNARMLQYLVEDCDVPLEERDALGLTPLYSAVFSRWETGAWILLRGGADVHNADRGRFTLSFLFPPILHLAVKRMSTKLVEELVRRGADISDKDFRGNDVLFAIRSRPLKLKKFVWEKVCESKSSTGQSPYDLGSSDLYEFLVSVFVFNDISAAKRLIKMRHSCEQRKMWQLLGAWFATNGKYKRALSCWRKETSKPCWLHDLNTEEETAPKSVFADILKVDVGQLLRESRLFEEEDQSILIRSLVVLESHVPQLPLLTTAVGKMVTGLLTKDQPVSAMRLLSRLTTLRISQQNEIIDITRYFLSVLDGLTVSSELSCSIVLEFLAMVSQCVWFLSKACPSNTDRQSENDQEVFATPYILCRLCRTVRLFKMNYVEAMNLFCRMEVPATPEQLQRFHGHTKDFVSCFSRTCEQDLFQFEDVYARRISWDPSVIKTLVVCSAEVKGQVRQENCPLHLAANADGDTPLLFFAQRLSQEDLLDNGVLECFLKHGADLCTRNRRGRSVRDILVERGILSAGELLPSLQCAAAAAFMRDPQLRGKVDQCGVAAVKHFLLDH